MLSLRCALPTMPMAAEPCANHLAALLLPLALRRLYIVRDGDTATDGPVQTPRKRQVSTRALCRPGLATSTKISAPSASTNLGRHCALIRRQVGVSLRVNSQHPDDHRKYPSVGRDSGRMVLRSEQPHHRCLSGVSGHSLRDQSKFSSRGKQDEQCGRKSDQQTDF